MGSWQLPQDKDQRIAKTDLEVRRNVVHRDKLNPTGFVRKLWIDGVLTTEQFEGLKTISGFDYVDQHEHWALAYFNRGVDGMALKAILDPNVFVLQKTKDATMLEINFNPTPEQMKKLREFMSKIRLVLTAPNA